MINRIHKAMVRISSGPSLLTYREPAALGDVSAKACVLSVSPVERAFHGRLKFECRLRHSRRSVLFQPIRFRGSRSVVALTLAGLRYLPVTKSPTKPNTGIG